jgi:hypothetical protein
MTLQEFQANTIFNARFLVITMVIIMFVVFWVVISCSLVGLVVFLGNCSLITCTRGNALLLLYNFCFEVWIIIIIITWWCGGGKQ